MDKTKRTDEISRALSRCSEIMKENNLAIATDVKCKIFVVDKLTGKEAEIILEQEVLNDL